VTVTLLLSMNILILGTGALGTLFAARLSQAGHHITMLGSWQHGLDALRENGVRLIDSNGHEHQFKVHATDDPRECTGAKYALVLVKAWQTERAAGQLAECLAPDGLAITLQNGLGNYETLTQSLGLGRVALGAATTGATLLGPGLARAGGEGIISIQRDQALGGVLSVSKGPLEAGLKSAGFNVQIVEDAQSLVWGKLVINAAINPLTALLRVQNGDLLEHPSTRELMEILATEVAQVAAAEGINLPFSDAVATVVEVAHKTKQNHSSMLQDVLRKSPTEIDAINGAVVQAAQRHQLEVPVNRTCWKLVKALTEQ
jgi:2-dehydropantoate 2-reductase